MRTKSTVTKLWLLSLTGTLVVSTYAASPDITATVTPDLKCPEGEGQVLWVSLGGGKCRLGGSALAQCFKQVGNEVPDLDSPEQLVSAFNMVQELLAGKCIHRQYLEITLSGSHNRTCSFLNLRLGFLRFV